MTQEDKKLLLIDLCARLPYGIICECLHSNTIKATAIDTEDLSVYYFDCDEWESIGHCKPYLRPMSSMTEEEEKEFQEIKLSYHFDEDSYILFDWLNKKMFDYRGLIEKGLTLEAPKGMYK